MQTTRTMELIPIDLIRPSSLNPRKIFDQAALEELAASIRDHGLIEPIVVRDRHPESLTTELFEIVAGERRWRAAKMAGLEEVPVRHLGQISDADALQLALIENLQRQDLDPIEEAEGYRQLNRVVGLRQAEIAAVVNRSQPAIANAMRLLELPEDVQEKIRAGELSASHGIALARWKDFPAIVQRVADQAAQDGLTAKQVERFDLSRNDFIANGLVRNLNRAEFDTAQCHECPFGAYRVKADGYWKTEMCLKPEHFDELWAAADTERKAAIAQQLEAAGLDDERLPKLSDLKWDEYERFHLDRPKACTKNCPCCVTALDHAGAPVQVCLDPKRFKGLKAAETRAQKKNQRERIRERKEVLDRHLEQSPLGAKGMAVLVAAALISVGRPTSIKEAAEHVGCSKAIEGLGFRPYELRKDTPERLAELGSSTLVRLGVEALLRNELALSVEYDYYATPWLDYFLGDVEIFGAESEQPE